MESIGLLGGSFDPIHVGHLQLARDALANLPIAEVHLVPAAQPWQKEALTAPEHRVQMIRLAIDNQLPSTRRRMVLVFFNDTATSEIYTVDTLREQRAFLGPDAPLVLIMGADQFERFDTWREWEQICELGACRGGARAAAEEAASRTAKLRDARYLKYPGSRQEPAGNIVDLAMTPVDASATEVRRLLAQGPTPEGEARLVATVPPPVLDYIRAHHLYAGPHGQKLQRVIVDALEDVKGHDIQVFNTTALSDMFDRVVIASGTSNRQTRALASSVAEKVKAAGGQRRQHGRRGQRRLGACGLRRRGCAHPAAGHPRLLQPRRDLGWQIGATQVCSPRVDSE
jgi:nicotinate-nucleotide adenylyltransferase